MFVHSLNAVPELTAGDTSTVGPSTSSATENLRDRRGIYLEVLVPSSSRLVGVPSDEGIAIAA